MKNKAYLVDVISQKSDYKKNFTHTGVYSFENFLYNVQLNFDNRYEILKPEGHICEVFFSCSVIKESPLTVIFEPVFIDSNIANDTIEYSASKEDAFLQTIESVKNLIKLKFKESDPNRMQQLLSLYNNDLMQKYAHKIKETNPPCSGQMIVFDKFYKNIINPFTL